jgi:hypothetical protein
MERLKRMRKELGDRILHEEEKKDTRESKSKGMLKSVRSSTNESNFKQPGHTTPQKQNRGGNTSGMSSGSRQNISAMQPQSQSSPGIDQRMGNIHLGLDGKK